ncbi:hypothetical protein HQ590_11900 [bacterium]|nr:hypothetical protein [bacterium]
MDQPDQVTAVAAVDRAARQSYPGAFDRSSARFTVSNLPTNTPLDCVIDYAGARLEGVNFHVPRSDYVEEQPLSVEDVATITDKIGRMNQFENIVDILTITGNVQHAVILLNKLRTTEFIGRQPGEVIWRAELWHFERPEETWAKVQDELFVVLYRERIPNKVYRKKAIVFDPRLGGLRLTAEVPEVDLGEIRLPAPQPGVRLRQGEEIK